MIIVFWAVSLTVSIVIVLIIARRWNRENNQQSLRESMSSNFKQFRKIIFENETIGIISMDTVFRVSFPCVLIVFSSTFFRLINHGSPCDINYINVKDIDIKHSIIISKKDLR